jgi:aspartyl aminopeptidase
MELLLIRHALPVRRELVTARADPELSSAGQAQAGHLADYLATERLDAVYSSPLRRAVETGTPVAARHGFDPLIIDDVAEWDRMASEYVPVEELKAANDPRWRALVAGVVDERREPGPVPRPRAGRDRASRRCARRGPHRRVCHGGVINTYLAAVLGLDPKRPGFFYPNYTSIHRVMAAGTGGAFDRDDQRDIASARHRTADRAAPDWLTMPGPHSLADLVTHLDASPSPFHSVESSRGRLEAAGFSAISERDGVGCVPERGVVARDGALIAWVLPASDHPAAAFRLVGAHTDSPACASSRTPTLMRWVGVNSAVEVYGGVLLNSWLDRDLGIAGRVLTADGASHLVDVHRPVARVPQLAIHLDRGVNDTGLKLDAQQHVHPVWGSGTSTPGEFAEWLADAADIDAPDVVGAVPLRRAGCGDPGWRCLVPRQRAPRQPGLVLGRDLGVGRVTGRRHGVDDRAESITRRSGRPARPAPVGRSSNTSSKRLVTARGGTRDDLLRALSGSRPACRRQRPRRAPQLRGAPRAHPPPRRQCGSGHQVNANQRYATSADTAAVFQRACAAAGVPCQVFVSRNNMPCGSTIGPLTATRLGIATVDVGVPQLSMHSARELCGVHDPPWLASALAAYFVRRALPARLIATDAALRLVVQTLQFGVEPIGVLLSTSPAEGVPRRRSAPVSRVRSPRAPCVGTRSVRHVGITRSEPPMPTARSARQP